MNFGVYIKTRTQGEYSRPFDKHRGLSPQEQWTSSSSSSNTPRMRPKIVTAERLCSSVTRDDRFPARVGPLIDAGMTRDVPLNTGIYCKRCVMLVKCTKFY